MLCAHALQLLHFAKEKYHMNGAFIWRRCLALSQACTDSMRNNTPLRIITTIQFCCTEEVRNAFSTHAC
jgi:hypothetical protein